jgi:hypothetical protein
MKDLLSHGRGVSSSSFPHPLLVWTSELSPPHPHARFDAIRILEGTSVFQSGRNPLVASLCGTLTPSSLPDPYVLGTSVVIQFVTDSAGTALGFLGQFEAVTPASCTGTVSVSPADGAFGLFAARPSGSTLSSTLVPAYVQGAACAWVVAVPQPDNLPGYVIRALLLGCLLWPVNELRIH